MSNAGVISVIVPVYSVEKFLPQCVESIINQTYKNLEIILVDDGSPDNCPAICDAYAKKDSRIKVIHKSNGGRSDARNAGIDIALGEYIGFIDSDDYIEPDMYEKMLFALQRANADLCICRSKSFSETNPCIAVSVSSAKDDVLLSSDEILFKLLHEGYPKYIVPFNKLYKRELFSDIRYPVGKENEDEAIIHLIYGKCKTVVLVNGVYCNYRVHGGSFTQQKISIKKYDAVDAFINRTNYLIKINKPELAAFSLFCTARVLRNLYLAKDNNTKEISKKEKELSLNIKLLYNSIDKNLLSFKQKITIISVAYFIFSLKLLKLIKK